MKKSDFDKPIEKFKCLIADNPTDFLNRYGLVMHKIAEDGGSCKSITHIAKHLSLDKKVVSQLCSKLHDKNYISLTKDGNKKILKFV